MNIKRWIDKNLQLNSRIMTYNPGTPPMLVGEGKGIRVGEKFIIGRGDDKDLYIFSAKAEFPDLSENQDASELYPRIKYYFETPSGQKHRGSFTERSSAIISAIMDGIRHPTLGEKIYYHTKHILVKWKVLFFSFFA